MRIRTLVAAAAVAGVTVLGTATAASADSGAVGGAAGSPGVLSGNNLQLPIHIPINACGDSLDIIGLLNPAFGNVCANG
ncbi:chaplin [Phaeacidiphilus oryzae]|uniref:chaplin n=1 Tax=Phaeacidiphilus oryzae TaxID=348818 RepID=UPI00056D9E23|nr:chaplin [Phaeacidiphilus oryzae]